MKKGTKIWRNNIWGEGKTSTKTPECSSNKKKLGKASSILLHTIINILIMIGSTCSIFNNQLLQLLSDLNYYILFVTLLAKWYLSNSASHLLDKDKQLQEYFDTQKPISLEKQAGLNRNMLVFHNFAGPKNRLKLHPK